MHKKPSTINAPTVPGFYPEEITKDVHRGLATSHFTKVKSWEQPKCTKTGLTNYGTFVQRETRQSLKMS